MRALIVKPISLIVILSWGAQNIAFGANPETTPKASANADDCRSICDEYRGGAVAGTASDSASNLQFSKEYVTSKCGTPATNSADTSGRKSSSNFIGQPGTEISKPSAGAANENEQGFDFNYQSGDKNFDACVSQLKDRWLMVGPQCAAISLYEEAKNLNIAAAVLYTVGAVTCLDACSITWLANIGQGACTGAGIAAAVTDIAATVKLDKAGEKERDQILKSDPGVYFGVVLGSIGGVASAATGTSLGVGLLSNSAETTVSAGTANTVFSCVAAGFLAASATAKYVSMDNIAGAGDEACQKIIPLKSFEYTQLKLSEDKSKKPTGTGTQKSDSKEQKVTAPGGGGGSEGDGFNAFADQIEKDFLSGRFAAATSGPGRTLLNALDRSKVNQDLKRLASATVKDIAKVARGASSPGAVFGAISGLPPSVQTALQAVERDTKAGKFAQLMGKDSGSTMIGGGGARPGIGAPARPAFGLGFKGAESAPVAGGEQNFEKMAKAPELMENGDIWHEGYNGTIFQLVSGKLSKNIERIDQLEWETPLNRALAGLPSKKAAEKPQLLLPKGLNK